MSDGSGNWTQRVQEWMLHNKIFDRPFIALLRLSESIGARAKNRLTSRQVLRSPDRAVLRGPLFSALRNDKLTAGTNILWIGCAPYTADYYQVLESEGANCFTIDFNPGERIWGRRGRHIVGSMLDLATHYPASSFELVICNGVLGYGVNAVKDQRRAFEEVSKVLAPGGALVVGWNTDKMEDPVEAGLHEPDFVHRGIADFPNRRAVEGTTHIYDCFRKRTA